MKKYTKSVLAALLASTMLLSVTACGGDSGKDTSDGGGTEGGTTKMTMWHIQTQENVATYIDEAMDRFAAANPGYEMEATAFQNDPYKTKLIAAMSANELPDVFIHWTGGPMKSYVDAGACYDITEFMEKDGYKDQFLDAAIEQATYKDSIWAVPVENVSPGLFFYNKAVFEQVGVEVPTTFAEFEAVSDKFLEAGIIPMALANKTKWTSSIIYGYVLDRIAGPTAFADAVDGKEFAGDDYVKAAEIMQDWAEKGYFGPDFNGLDYDSGQDRQLLYNNQAAMYVMGGWFLFTAQGENPDFVENIGVAPFPTYEGGKGSATEYIGTIGDNFYSVSSSSKNPEMAFTAITYMLDEQGIKDRIESGKLPPLKDMTYTDEISKTISDAANSATHMQLWLDQYLAPEGAEIHKDAIQQLLGGSITPDEYNAKMTEAAKSES
jgi:raffinose/stachyose/melibiose transport system substrate-binding protein